MATATGYLMANVLSGISPFDAAAMLGSAAVLAGVVPAAVPNLCGGRSVRSLPSFCASDVVVSCQYVYCDA